MKAHFLKDRITCPRCGNPNDGATGHQRPPRPGDFTLCMYCGHLSRYTGDMKLRTPSDEEMEQVYASDPLFKMQIAAVKAVAEAALKNKQTKNN